MAGLSDATGERRAVDAKKRPARRFLFLTQTFPRHRDDTAGPFVRELARALVRGGDRVTALIPHARGVASAWSDDGIEVRSFRYAPVALEVIGYSRSLRADERLTVASALVAPLYLAAARRAVRSELARAELARGGYDLVQAHWIVPNGLVASPRPSREGLRRGSRSPAFAIGLHGSDVFLAEKPIVRRLVRRALGRCALVTGCSPELVARVQALGPGGGDYRVIPYGVDAAVFHPGADGAARWRDELGIAEHETLLLGVGRMATKKGFQVLVAALPDLLGRFPHLRVVLAGGGDRLAELQAATRDWPGRVLFPGAVARDRLPGLFAAADLFVLPAVHDPQGNVDGLPNVILEAMASGLAVVSTAISGIPLAVRTGVDGLLVPEQDPEALARALGDLLRQPERRVAMGKSGRERVELDLTWDRVAALYRAGYEAAIVG